MEKGDVEIIRKQIALNASVIFVCLLVFGISLALFDFSILPFAVLAFLSFILIIFGLNYEQLFYVFLFVTLSVPHSSVIGSISVGGISIYIGEIMFLLLSITFLIEIAINPRNPKVQIPSSLINILVVIFLALGIRAFLVSYSIDIVKSRRVIRGFVFMLVAILISAFVKEESDIKKTSRVFFYSLFLFLLLYLLQVFLPGLFAGVQTGIFRFRFTVQTLTVAVLMFVIQLMIDKNSRRDELFLYVIIILLSAVSIVFSQDRTVWAGLVIAMFSLFVVNLLLQRGIRRFYTILIATGIVGLAATMFLLVLPLLSNHYRAVLFVLEQRVETFRFLRFDSAILERIYRHRVVMNEFYKSPLLGAGLALPAQPHDIYSLILSYSGIVGALVWIAITANLVYNYIYYFINHRFIENSEAKSFMAVLIALFPYWIATSIVEAHLWNQHTDMVMLMLSVVCGNVMVKTIKRKKKNEKQYSEFLDNSTH